MDVEKAVPAPLKPAEAAAEAYEGARHEPLSYLEMSPNPAARAAAAEVEQRLTPLDRPTSGQTLATLTEQSTIYATRAYGPGTRRAYRSAWMTYQSWCEEHELDPFAGAAGPLPLYVTYLAETGRAISSIRVALAAIATAYRIAGLALDLRDPKLLPVIQGVVRSVGVAPRHQANPAVPDVLSALLAQCGRDEHLRAALAARDRAMLLLGFGAALRRSELVALNIGDAEMVTNRGIILHVRRSKTDQQGRGEQVAIWANPANPAFCPFAAVEKWLLFRQQAADLAAQEAAGDTAARPLFCAVTKGGRITGTPLSDKAVVRLIKSMAAAAGFNSKHFSGHSLRAGLATAAGDAGVGLADVMRQTRHKSPQVALTYLRPADLWRNNATERLFRDKN